MSHRIVTALAMISLVLAVGCEDRSRTPTGPTNEVSAAPGRETYLRGQVVDTVGRPVPAALVEIVGGPRAGTRLTTDDEGRFDLTSTAAAESTSTLRVSRDGFETATSIATWQRERNERILVTRLHNLGQPLGLGAGDYTLNITMELATADRRPAFPEGVACLGFPTELASRTYDATIVEQPHGERHVRIKGATVRSSASQFTMWVAGDSAAVDLEWPITEEFSGNRYLDIMGGAVPNQFSVDSNTVRVLFGADFRSCELTVARGIYNDCSQVPLERVVRQQWCSSERVVMTFTKR